MIRKLGRGLDSLIEETKQEARESPTALEVGALAPNPFQPREVMNEDAIEELCASIREHGVLQPVIVRPVG